MQGLLVAAVVLNSIILLAIVVGLGIIVARIGKAAKTAEVALEEVRRELPKTLSAAQGALRSVESLAAKSEDELETLDDVLKSVNRLVSGITVAEAAAKALTTSKVTAVSVISGIREGLRSLRRPSDTTKEE